MRISVCSNGGALSHSTHVLLSRMFSPLCGLNQRISFLLRSRLDPKFAVAGGELTGVHLMRDPTSTLTPNPLDYHIGGSGVYLDEAYVRLLGETAERYCQVVADIAGLYPVTLASYDKISRLGEPVVAREHLRFYSAAQFDTEGFPYQPFAADAPMGWVRVPSLAHDHRIWMPAQLLLVGYPINKAANEPWLNSAVTTGTATHSTPDLALRSALLELTQIDGAVGHWYSGSKTRRIAFDERTDAIDRLLRNQFPDMRNKPEFFWLPNADLPVITIACVIKPKHGAPAVGVGMGCGLRLGEAMYKALLEGVAVVQLAKIILVYAALEANGEPGEIDPQRIFDFNRNVAFYARPENIKIIDDRFDATRTIPASQLPPDSAGSPKDDIRFLIDAFRKSGKEIVFMDLTTQDVKEIGLCTLRVWSPDVLGLPLPSFPQSEHPRFRAYGGFGNEQPHPYP